MWACSLCDRTFRRVNQRHACGTGSVAGLLKNRPPALTDLYGRLERTVRRCTTRIFADLTVMRDALRLVIHLGRKARRPFFLKIGESGKRISHVALVRTPHELSALVPFLREAFELTELED